MHNTQAGTRLMIGWRGRASTKPTGDHAVPAHRAHYLLGRGRHAGLALTVVQLVQGCQRKTTGSPRETRGDLPCHTASALEGYGSYYGSGRWVGVGGTIKCQGHTQALTLTEHARGAEPVQQAVRAAAALLL